MDDPLRGCATHFRTAIACSPYLHWFDRCPLIEVARNTPEGQRARELTKSRADAILDALYGDHDALTRADT
jgi:hypothetical protein